MLIWFFNPDQFSNAEEPNMSQTHIVGLDLAKQIFQVQPADPEMRYHPVHLTRCHGDRPHFGGAADASQRIAFNVLSDVELDRGADLVGTNVSFEIRHHPLPHIGRGLRSRSSA